MIERVHIRGLRGIRAADLTGLTNLTILVGPNGSGKSTILDSLLIAAAPVPADSVGRVVRRRLAVQSGAPWLLWRASESEPAFVSINSNRPEDRVCRVRRCLDDSFRALEGLDAVFGLEVRAWIGSLDDQESPGKFAVSEWLVGFDRENRYGTRILTKGNWTGPFVRLVDTVFGGIQAPLHKVFSAAVRQGGKPWARELMSKVIPDFKDIEILTDDDGSPVVHIEYNDRSVPVGLAGDGIQALARVCLELASARAPGSLLLLEEPELHGHPGVLGAMSRAIVDTACRDVQVVISTHSLDLLRYLLDESRSQDAIGQVSVFQIRLVDGKTVWSRLPGPEAELRLETIGDDLR